MTPGLIQSLDNLRLFFVQGTAKWVAVDEAIRVIEQAQETNGRLQAELVRIRACVSAAIDLVGVESTDADFYRDLHCVLTAALNPPKPEEQT